MKTNREQWYGLVKKRVANVDKLVFLDESGVNIDMIRRYGRAKGGKRVCDKSPVNTPTNTTLLSGIRINEVTARTSYRGGTTKGQFIKYIKETLCPILKRGECVVMDNLGVHHSPEVKEAIEKVGANVLYLPPYSPDMHPIEKMWSKIKAFLRKVRASDLSTLYQAIDNAFASVSSDDCRGWFKSAGYSQ